MSQQRTWQDVEIPVEVIETDRRLEQQKQTASFALDKHRWEQCADPRGPRYTQQAYADAVGRRQSAIGESVNAWATALQRQNSLDRRAPVKRVGGKGRTQSDAVESVGAAIEAGQQVEDPTPEVHAESKQIARHGEERAALHAALAEAFGVAASTLTRNTNWTHWRSRAIELMDDYAQTMSVADAVSAATRAVVEEKQNYDDMERNRAARQASEAARPAGWMDAINPLMEMAETGKHALARVRGDLDTGLLDLDSDARELIENLLGEIKEITDHYAFALIVVQQ